MIAKLRGKVDTIGDDFCIVDVNGVGYLVFASAKSLGKLKIGAEASLLIETVVREDSISLFGFADAWEKEWFTTLTKVQGVGAKVCLAILSVWLRCSWRRRFRLRIKIRLPGPAA